MSKWTIQVFFDGQTDKGTVRATCAYWVEAADIPSAYQQAEDSFKSRPNTKFGFILPGHHEMLPGFSPMEREDAPDNN